MLTRVTRALGWSVVTLQKTFCVAAGLGLALLMVAQVFMRYVLEAPMLGIEEASVLLGEWIYFLGAAHVTWRDGHIRGGLANVIIRNERARLILKACGRIVCLIINLVLAYYSIAYWIAVAESGRTSVYLSWPSTLWVGAMAVGLVLMSGYLLLSVVEDIRTMGVARTETRVSRGPGRKDLWR